RGRQPRRRSRSDRRRGRLRLDGPPERQPAPPIRGWRLRPAADAAAVSVSAPRAYGGAMITLHDSRCSANGHKVRLLLSQLDRPYHLIEVDIFGGESKTDAYLALNPDGRIPLLVLE